MNMLAPLRLTLSVRTAMHALFGSLLMVYFGSWLGYRSATITLFTGLCFSLYQVFRYKLQLVKYTGAFRSLHMKCAGFALAAHLVAASGFVIKMKTVYSVLYALTALAVLWEYTRGVSRELSPGLIPHNVY